MVASQVSETIANLYRAASTPPKDVEDRRALFNAARKLMLSVEMPQETAQRVFYGGLPLTLAVIGVDLGLFKILSRDPETTFSVSRLAEITGSEERLLLRILRGLVAHALIGESTEETYYANEATILFADDAVAAGAKHTHLHVSPPFQCLPEFRHKTQYRNPSDPKNLPFQMGLQTEKPAFEWLSTRPENLGYFTVFMSSQRTSQKPWMTGPTLFPTKEFTIQSEHEDVEAVLMVDVGGDAGHQSVALRQAHGDLKGRVVLQDLPETISMIDQSALEQLGIEAQAHDFMTAQPVIGAKVYYMRNILHDWPDVTCLANLKQLRAAMTKDSVIIIDEVVVQSSESTWKQANVDFVTMAALGGQERTKNQWLALLSEASLELRGVRCYDSEAGDTLLIA